MKCCGAVQNETELLSGTRINCSQNSQHNLSPMKMVWITPFWLGQRAHCGTGLLWPIQQLNRPGELLQILDSIPLNNRPAQACLWRHVLSAIISWLCYSEIVTFPCPQKVGKANVVSPERNVVFIRRDPKKSLLIGNRYSFNTHMIKWYLSAGNYWKKYWLIACKIKYN